MAELRDPIFTENGPGDNDSAAKIRGNEAILVPPTAHAQ
jgi:hypothetical protein